MAMPSTARRLSDAPNQRPSSSRMIVGDGGTALALEMEPRQRRRHLSLANDPPPRPEHPVEACNPPAHPRVGVVPPFESWCEERSHRGRARTGVQQVEDLACLRHHANANERVARRLDRDGAIDGSGGVVTRHVRTDPAFASGEPH